jgi:hypothetical protein
MSDERSSSRPGSVASTGTDAVQAHSNLFVVMTSLRNVADRVAEIRDSREFGKIPPLLDEVDETLELLGEIHQDMALPFEDSPSS